jgi:ABC-2 type transport system ATP-binding protein
VHKESVNRVVGQVLAQLPVSDLTVENPPLEEVMSELFARGRAAAAGAKPVDDASPTNGLHASEGPAS